MTEIRAARSLLFVPGDRPERFTKAALSGADLIVIDLEDAVAPGRKSHALANTLAWLDSHAHVVVRINGAGTPWHDHEIAALAPTSAFVILPKAESADTIAELHHRLAGDRVIALVETAEGLRDIDAVCAAPGVARAALGTVDLGAELGVDPANHAAFAYARSRLVAASAAAGLTAPIDGVTTTLACAEPLSDDLTEASDLGFGGKLCIHPAQVEPVNRHFSPSQADVDWAQSVCAAAAAGTGVLVVDGAMVDAPVVRRAQAILCKAHFAGPAGG